MSGRGGHPDPKMTNRKEAQWSDGEVAEGGLVPEGEFRDQAVRNRCRAMGATHILQLGKVDSHAHEAENEVAKMATFLLRLCLRLRSGHNAEATQDNWGKHSCV